MDGEAEFDLLLREIEKQTGFQQGGYKKSFLHRRVAIRMRANSISGFTDYMRFIRDHDDEVPILLDRLTVNVTEFFRNRDVFESIGKGPMAELSKKNQGLKIWSAGSSEGREAYSMAIMLKRIMGEKASNVNITATDIDDAKLEAGRNGIYHFNGQRELDREFPLWAKSFIRIKDDHTVEIPSDIKGMVHFRHHDLLKDGPMKNLDMILCRNLMIYFPKEAQILSIKKFHSSLREGGYLVIGKTEHIPVEIKDLFKPLDLRARIYTK